MKILNDFQNIPKRIKFIVIYNVLCVFILTSFVFWRGTFLQLAVFLPLGLLLLSLTYFLIKKNELAFYLILLFYAGQLVVRNYPLFGYSYGLLNLHIRTGFFTYLNITPVIVFFILVSDYKDFTQSDKKLFFFTALIILFAIFVKSEHFGYRLVAGKYVDPENPNNYILLNTNGEIVIRETHPYYIGGKVSEQHDGFLKSVSGGRRYTYRLSSGPATNTSGIEIFIEGEGWLKALMHGRLLYRSGAGIEVAPPETENVFLWKKR